MSKMLLIFTSLIFLSLLVWFFLSSLVWFFIFSNLMAHCCHVFTSQLSLKIGFLDSIITCQHTFLKQILLILAVPIILSHKGQRKILLLIFHRKWKDWQNFWKLKTLHCGLNFRTCLLLLLLLTKCSSGNSKMWLCQSFAPLQHSLALIPDGGMIQLKFLSVFSENLFSYFVNSSSDLCLFQINVGRRCFNFLMSSALYRRKQAKEENEIKTK